MYFKYVSIAVVTIGIAYFLYVPLHDGIHDQTMVRGLSQVIETTEYRISYRIGRPMFILKASISEAVGFDTYINSKRNIILYFIEDNKPPEMDGLETEDYAFDGVDVRLYRPTTAEKHSPCVIYFHGGGWTLQSVDTYDAVVADLALESGYVFISVEYRLAPEHPFPIPFEDCYRATLHLMKNAEKYGVNPNRIGLAGDSAGGNLAAAVSLKLKDVDIQTPVRFQWLINPALQAVDFKLPSYVSNKDAMPHFLQPVDMARFYCNYLGIPATEATLAVFLNNQHISKDLNSKVRSRMDYRQIPSRYRGGFKEETVKNGEGLSKKIQTTLVHPHFSPLMAQDLSGLPPTFVVTAEHDVLRDDGLLFAERLRKSGVDVTSYNSPHSVHSYMYWTSFSPRYKDANNTIEQFMKFSVKHFQL